MKNKDNSKNSNGLIRLINGRLVPADLLDLVRFVVQEKIPALSHDTAYTLRDIFGKEKWSDLNPINKIDAGYCMVHLVKTGEVPFKFAKDKGDNNKRYQLK
jgi:hypothetical protein